MAARYEIIETVPHTYMDKALGVVNGVLIRVRLVDYNEYHEVRVPALNAAAAKKAIDLLLKERDDLAALSAG